MLEKKKEIKETVIIGKIGRSVGIRFSPTLLEQLQLAHKDKVQIRVIKIVKGSEELKQIDLPLIINSQMVKSGNSLGITINKKVLQVIDINIGDVLNVEIEKVAS